MSLLSLLDPEKERSQIDKQFDSGIRSTPSEVFQASRKENLFNFNSTAEFNSYSKAVKDISDEFLKYDKEKELLLDPKEQELRKKFRSLNLKGNIGRSMVQEAKETMAALKELRPDLELPDVTERAHKVALDSKTDAERVRQGKEGTLGTIAEFAGGFAASFQDPVDLMSMFIPAGKAMGVGRAFLMGAVENAGIEVLKAPTISKWQKELGEKYGVREAVTQVVTAAAFGGVLSGGGRAIGKALETKGSKAAKTSKVISESGKDVAPQADAPQLKVSDAFEELSTNEKIPQEAREAFAIQAKHQRAIESRPSFVSEEAHLRAVAEIEMKMKKGEFPDMNDIHNIIVRDKSSRQAPGAIDFKEEPAPFGSGSPKSTEALETIETPRIEEEIFAPRMSQEKARNLYEISDFKARTAKSTEVFSQAKESLEVLAKDSPDELVEVGGQSMRISELNQRVKENENLLKALDICEVS